MPFKRQKSNVSPHYHDTRTLLRKYRDVMWNLEVSDLDLQEEFKAEYGLSTDALFVDNEVNKGGNRLENYARALERSKKMMQIIDTAIDLMRRKHKKGEFYYWILYYAYVQCPPVRKAGGSFYRANLPRRRKVVQGLRHDSRRKNAHRSGRTRAYAV